MREVHPCDFDSYLMDHPDLTNVPIIGMTILAESFVDPEGNLKALRVRPKPGLRSKDAVGIVTTWHINDDKWQPPSELEDVQ